MASRGTGFARAIMSSRHCSHNDIANVKFATALDRPYPACMFKTAHLLNISSSSSDFAERTDVMVLVLCLDGVCDQGTGLIRNQDAHM